MKFMQKDRDKINFNVFLSSSSRGGLKLQLTGREKTLNTAGHHRKIPLLLSGTFTVSSTALLVYSLRTCLLGGWIITVKI